MPAYSDLLSHPDERFFSQSCCGDAKLVPFRETRTAKDRVLRQSRTQLCENAHLLEMSEYAVGFS